MSNSIFKANLNSLLDISKENLVSIANKNEKFIRDLIQTENDGNSDRVDWKRESSHLANIDWLLLNSIYISTFSLFEFHLFALARIVEERKNDIIKINDIRGSGIPQYSNYLYLVGKIDTADRSKGNWDKISKYRKVRNVIAHNGGIIISDPTNNLEDHELYKFLKERKVAMAGSLGHIRITNSTVIESFKEITSRISDKLTKEISEKYPDEK